VREAKGGKIEYRVEKAGIVHARVGKVSFAEGALAENARALINALVRAKPSTAKGVYVRSITISSTMGPGVKIDTGAFVAGGTEET
jgi:large subunit ribosomal protein L1